jgi:hypothetical protein
MGERLNLNKENELILLYNQGRKTFENKTDHINAIYKVFYYGNFTGYDIYFSNTKGKFFYKAENVKILNIKSNIDISHYDVYVDHQLISAISRMLLSCKNKR